MFKAHVIQALCAQRIAGTMVVMLAMGHAAWGASPAQGVVLVSDGRAPLPVVVAADAAPASKQAAATLAEYLGKMSGAAFAVEEGDGKRGIAVGTAAELPALGLSAAFQPEQPTHREDYLLRSHPGGLYVVAATATGVQHAVWDLLYRLGHRHFFPSPHWEIVPRVDELRIAVDTVERPDYYARRIWYGFGAWDYAAKPYAAWCAKNRATSGIELRTGHAYDGILAGNKAEFKAHPEYLGLVGGERKSTKFCISNPGLRQLVVRHALQQFDKDPTLDSVSVDPSDGGGWCECDACAKLGSVSDRALTLANDVAAAVNAKHPGKLVGMYAYAYHSPPPSLEAHPQVVISVATAFIKGGHTVDDLIRGWSAKAKMLGIREYYSVNTWDRDLPAKARGGNLDYLKRTIPEFHAKGARFLSAESSDNWGPNGLGYYLAARMLWDVDEAKRVDELVEDFLTRAFGAAKTPMREYYRQLDSARPHLVAADQLGRMFRSLEEARRLANSAEVRARLDDLVLYARYVDLYQRYAKAKGEARQAAFEALIRHAYRMRTTMLVHAKALYRDLVERDKAVAIPAEARWQVPEAKNPWKSSKPFAPDELAGFLREGIEHYPLSEVSFEPAAYSDDLVSAEKLNLPETPSGQWGAGRGKQVFLTRIERAPAEIELQITGGLISHYRDRGNVRVQLWKLGGASQTGERETLTARDESVVPDGQEHSVELKVAEPGLYRLTVEDGSDRTLVKWASRLPLTIKSTPDEPMNEHYADGWQLYFYVPKGTKTLGLFGGGQGEIRDATGRTAFDLKGREANYYSVAVPDGEDGRLWSVRHGRGPIRLITVPPYFARYPVELLLPAEVVAKDAGK